MDRYLIVQKLNSSSASSSSSSSSSSSEDEARRLSRMKAKMPVLGSTPCTNFALTHAIAEVQGRLESSHRQAVLQYMFRSFSEIGKFPQVNQNFHPTTRSAQFTHSDQGLHTYLPHPNQTERDIFATSYISRPHITGLEFDSKGVYLASVSSTGFLAIHDYESLHYNAQGSIKNIMVPVVQLSLGRKLEAVRWNPKNQDEVACITTWGGKVFIYDISRVTDAPAQVLKVKSSTAKSLEYTGLADVAFCKLHENRILACGKHGEIYVWDRRVSNLSQSTFSCQQGVQLYNLALARDEQIIYSGSSLGQLHAWDFREGRNAVAFVAPSQAFNAPFSTWKIATLLQEIPLLQAQTDIETSGIQSVCLNPCCDKQLAFHLNNGWSGVFDLASLTVTHLHCPPPPWLYEDGDKDIDLSTAALLERKPTWLSAHSIYACPSPSSSKVNFLDFCARLCSPHHVENGNEAPTTHVETPTSESVGVCASHPLNDSIVAGTPGALILIIEHQKGINRSLEDSN